jgi:integrase
MPLTLWKRGNIYWAQGRILHGGRALSGYLRESTGASDEAGARAWIAGREEAELRRHYGGAQSPQGATSGLIFAQAVLDYPATTKTARYLAVLIPQIGHHLITSLTPRMIRDLGPMLYPQASTDTWTRQIITPVRAVINHAMDDGEGKPFRVRGYTKKERLAQDAKRGQASRVERSAGSWPWLLAFRQAADNPRLAALALFMFATGARISQAVAMHPAKHLDLQNARVCVPAAKGMEDRWIIVPMEVVVDLANLTPSVPRGWPDRPENLRVFGYADRGGPRKGWAATCARAGIVPLGRHAAGRHGFGQEMRVRQGVDKQSASAFGGWSDVELMDRTYTHAEDASAKIAHAFRTGLAQAEAQTGLKLLKSN